jgi:hypothetical protein
MTKMPFHIAAKRLGWALAALALASCQDSAAPDEDAAAPVQFRAAAQAMYVALERPPCRPGTSPVDPAAFAEEQAAIARPERDLAKTPALTHLHTARADARFALDEDRQCREDYGNAESRAQQLDAARRTVGEALPELARLAPLIRTPAAAPIIDDRQAAALRYHLRAAVSLAHPVCRLSSAADDAAALAPAARRLADFRMRLDASGFGGEFAIAQADALHALSLTIVECAAPSPRPPAETSAALLAEMEAHLRRASAAIGPVDKAPPPAASRKNADLALYREVRRLNDACDIVGGGVSGSPDCEAATVKEAQLEARGLCIDYRRGEQLVRCAELDARPGEPALPQPPLFLDFAAPAA